MSATSTHRRKKQESAHFSCKLQASCKQVQPKTLGGMAKLVDAADLKRVLDSYDPAE